MIKNQISLPLELLIRLHPCKSLIPRPQNAFIIYRKGFQNKLVLAFTNEISSDLSLISKNHQNLGIMKRKKSSKFTK
jgi:hypothetical protein